MRNLIPRRIRRRRHIAVGHRKANRLTNTCHCVGRILAATCAMSRACHALKLFKFGQGTRTRRIFADNFKDVFYRYVLVIVSARQNRPAVYKYGRDIEAQHGHHHAWQRLVATRKPNQCVITMAAYRKLNGVCDDFTAYERGLHALMSHGNAVGNGNCVKSARHPPTLLNADARNISLGIQRRVAWRTVISCRDDPNERARNFLSGQSHGIIIAAMRRTFWPHGNMTAWQFGLVELV